MVNSSGSRDGGEMEIFILYINLRGFDNGLDVRGEGKRWIK